MASRLQVLFSILDSEVCLSSIISREPYRAAYHAQQRTLLYQCLAGHQMLRKLVSLEMKPTKSAVQDGRARYGSLLARDLANVEAGYYPRELLFQLPVTDYMRLFPKLVSDFPRTIRRAQRKDWKDLPVNVELEQYPPYYCRNFHWQTAATSAVAQRSSTTWAWSSSSSARRT